jgi:hypothetical protein
MKHRGMVCRWSGSGMLLSPALTPRVMVLCHSSNGGALGNG